MVGLALLDRDVSRGCQFGASLERGNYRVFATPDPAVALRLVRRGDCEVVLTDLESALMEAVPHWARRRGDVPPQPTPLGECYAVLRPLDGDLACPRRPIVVLTQAGESLPCEASQRFGLVGFVPRVLDPSLVGALDAALAPLGGSFAIEDPGAVFAVVPRSLRRLLVLERGQGVQRLVAGALAAHDCRIEAAADAAQARQLAMETRPILVVAALEPARADALELLHGLQSNPVLDRTPVVWVEVEAGGGLRREAIGAGVADYLCQPLDVRELEIRLALVLKRHRDRLEGRPPRLEGSLAVVGAVGALQACHSGRLSGVLVARSGGCEARIGFRQGEIVAAECEQATGVAGLRAFVAWPDGHFRFEARSPESVTPLGRFDPLLFEALVALGGGARDTDNAPAPKA